MKTHLLFSAVFLVAGSFALAEEPKTYMTDLGDQLLFEDFSQDSLGTKWRHVYSHSEIRDGALIAKQDPEADHGAVLETLIDFQDIAIQFSFRFEGTSRFNVPIDDKNHKESHAGHICRLSITPKSLLLGDDREGIMRNDIFAMRRDPERKAEANKLLKGRSSIVPLDLKTKTWYTITLEIAGDEMLVSLDGVPIGYLQSPGIGHLTKSDFGFTVNGQSLHLDNVAAWSVTKKPNWNNERADFVKGLTTD